MFVLVIAIFAACLAHLTTAATSFSAPPSSGQNLPLGTQYQIKWLTDWGSEASVALNAWQLGQDGSWKKTPLFDYQRDPGSYLWAVASVQGASATQAIHFELLVDPRTVTNVNANLVGVNSGDVFIVSSQATSSASRTATSVVTSSSATSATSSLTSVGSRTATSTSNFSASTVPTSSATAQPTTTSAANSGLPTTTKIALGVGLGVGIPIILLLVALIFVLNRLRSSGGLRGNKHKENGEHEKPEPPTYSNSMGYMSAPQSNELPAASRSNELPVHYKDSKYARSPPALEMP